MSANSICRDSDSSESSDKGYFRSFRTTHSSHMLREAARPEIVPDNRGHANIDVTQFVYGKSWWEERVDCGHPSCRSRNQCRSECRERREKESAWMGGDMPPDLECGGSPAVLNGLGVELRFP
jgi:hypothetical protein